MPSGGSPEPPLTDDRFRIAPSGLGFGTIERSSVVIQNETRRSVILARGLVQKVHEQLVDGIRFLLDDRMTSAGDEMRAAQPGANRIHRLERARILIDGPFLRAPYIAGRNINRFPRKAVELIPEWLVIVGSIVVESALESGPTELRCIDLQIRFGHPLARSDIF
jgi:hypothetical protein